MNAYRLFRSYVTCYHVEVLHLFCAPRSVSAASSGHRISSRISDEKFFFRKKFSKNFKQKSKKWEIEKIVNFVFYILNWPYWFPKSTVSSTKSWASAESSFTIDNSIVRMVVCSDSWFGSSPKYGVCKKNFTLSSHPLRKSIIFINFRKKRFIFCKHFLRIKQPDFLCRKIWGCSPWSAHDRMYNILWKWILENTCNFFRISKKLNEKFKLNSKS